MAIEIHQPALEALLNERMQSGRFRNIEEVIFQALQTPQLDDLEEATGERLIAVMQASPHKEIDIEPVAIPCP